MKRFVHLFSCVLVSCFTRVLHKSDFLEQESWINMKNVAEWREHCARGVVSKIEYRNGAQYLFIVKKDVLAS